jgi:acetyl-CoA decarbonylase/synthase complex subunit gamma
MLTPLLLPWLPGRAFSLKGLSIGVTTAFLFAALRGPTMINWPDRLEWTAWLLLIPAISGYLALNFTGCSTYTSLSGVKKETRLALPLEACAGVIGLGVWFLSRLAL